MQYNIESTLSLSLILDLSRSRSLALRVFLCSQLGILFAAAAAADALLQQGLARVLLTVSMAAPLLVLPLYTVH